MKLLTIKDIFTFIMKPYGVFGVIILFMVYGISSVLQLLLVYYLSEWTMSTFQIQQGFKYPLLFSLLTTIFFASTFIRAWLTYKFILKNSTIMHKIMSKNIIRATISFINSFDIGHFQTSFSKDLAAID